MINKIIDYYIKMAMILLAVILCSVAFGYAWRMIQGG